MRFITIATILPAVIAGRASTFRHADKLALTRKEAKAAKNCGTVGTSEPLCTANFQCEWSETATPKCGNIGATGVPSSGAGLHADWKPCITASAACRDAATTPGCEKCTFQGAALTCIPVGFYTALEEENVDGTMPICTTIPDSGCQSKLTKTECFENSNCKWINSATPATNGGCFDVSEKSGLTQEFHPEHAPCTAIDVGACPYVETCALCTGLNAAIGINGCTSKRYGLSLNGALGEEKCVIGATTTTSAATESTASTITESETDSSTEPLTQSVTASTLTATTSFALPSLFTTINVGVVSLIAAILV